MYSRAGRGIEHPPPPHDWKEYRRLRAWDLAPVSVVALPVVTERRSQEDGSTVGQGGASARVGAHVPDRDGEGVHGLSALGVSRRQLDMEGAAGRPGVAHRGARGRDRWAAAIVAEAGNARGRTGRAGQLKLPLVGQAAADRRGAVGGEGHRAAFHWAGAPGWRDLGAWMFCASVAILWLMLLLQSPAAAAICTVPIVCGALYVGRRSHVPIPR
jgi:hypothetical protein